MREVIAQVTDSGNEHQTIPTRGQRAAASLEETHASPSSHVMLGFTNFPRMRGGEGFESPSSTARAAWTSNDSGNPRQADTALAYRADVYGRDRSSARRRRSLLTVRGVTLLPASYERLRRLRDRVRPPQVPA